MLRTEKDAGITRDTNDRDVRSALVSFVRLEHANTPEPMLFEEFAVNGGEIRADLVALNGASHAYEIKSARDTLARLQQQMQGYNSVFEFVTLVSAPRHIEQAVEVIPEWWGVVRAFRRGPDVCLERIRPSLRNTSLDSQALAALLWRPEALQILSAFGLDKGLKSKPMAELINKLAVAIPQDRLATTVREVVRARGDWKAAAKLRRYGGMSRQLSSRWGFPRSFYGHSLR